MYIFMKIMEQYYSNKKYHKHDKYHVLNVTLFVPLTYNI